MYCTKCGNEIFDDAVVCLNCGCSVSQNRAENVSGLTEQTPTVVVGALIFGIFSALLFPPLSIVAIVLAINSKSSTGGVMVGKAKVALGLGIFGLCVFILEIILIAVLVLSSFGFVIGDYI